MTPSSGMKMTPEQFIGEAIDRGVRDGLPSLNQAQAFVFLISEAEVHCDMDGIDTFLDRYNSMEVLMTAEAFRSIGAKEIAKWLERIAALLPDRAEAEVTTPCP